MTVTDLATGTVWPLPCNCPNDWHMTRKIIIIVIIIIIIMMMAAAAGVVKSDWPTDVCFGRGTESWLLRRCAVSTDQNWQVVSEQDEKHRQLPCQNGNCLGNHWFFTLCIQHYLLDVVSETNMTDNVFAHFVKCLTLLPLWVSIHSLQQVFIIIIIIAKTSKAFLTGAQRRPTVHAYT